MLYLIFKFAWFLELNFTLTGFFEQPGDGFSALNVMETRDQHHAKRDRRHANVCKERTLQVDALVASPNARPRSRDSSIHVCCGNKKSALSQTIVLKM